MGSTQLVELGELETPIVLANTLLPNERVSPLFQAAIEATEEAIYNSLLAATEVIGYRDRCARPLPVERVLAVMRRYGRLGGGPCEPG
jgi:L-aminopeptidase/D-esterase-like protein